MGLVPEVWVPCKLFYAIIIILHVKYIIGVSQKASYISPVYGGVVPM